MGLARQSETLQAESRSGSARAPRKANPWRGKQHSDSKRLINILCIQSSIYKIQEFVYSLRL
ncbi:hypothetical protein CHH55_07020 [Niallia circulans]|nr:hypothetical protein CHH55_07020 [Niallia circulans]